MNSRERLLACIRHQPVDRVPISTYELVGWNPDSWENRDGSYHTLMEYIRKHTDCIYMQNPGIRNTPNPAAESKEWDEGESHYSQKTYQARGGMLTSLHRADRNIHTVWTLEHLLKELSDIEPYLSLPYEAPEFDMTSFYKEKEALGDKGLMMVSLEDPICLGAELFEMTQFLIYAMTEPEKIKYFLDAIHERQMADLKKMLRHDMKDVIFRICGPEYATPPYLPPSCFYDLVTCYLIPMCREIKAAGGIVRIHSHGKVGRVLDQFALTEADAIDPIEPPPDGDIELAEVKRLYGDRFCLFGNIELKELEVSDKARVDYLIQRAMQDAKEGSGFVLMPTAAPINTPLSPKTEENYVQMIDSALKYGQY